MKNTQTIQYVGKDDVMTAKRSLSYTVALVPYHWMLSGLAKQSWMRWFEPPGGLDNATHMLQQQSQAYPESDETVSTSWAGLS